VAVRRQDRKACWNVKVSSRKSSSFKSEPTGRDYKSATRTFRGSAAPRLSFIWGLSLRATDFEQAFKGIWWMPWHREAMKDVAPCEKLWEGGSNR
jgi:hypothetical protein